ncbi:MAG TPA: polyhydroxyalkanoate synthesis regulator DNA-binding domain-containing protein [Verrucomicrobiae bacterium]|nr:polyhydroxyalkanoate synthesis regulator DNA-binding domain-containing protein [Verrucomicrobiae bacterium]
MAVANEPSSRHLEIKKYPNRRYYDATHSRHLTLDEIRLLVQQGYDLHVVDAKTGADITGQVLTQIILELDTPKVDSLPVPLLVRLIRMNDQLVKDFIDKYFNQALKSFLDYQQQVEEQIRRAHGLPSVFPSVSAWTKAVLEPFASALASNPAQPGSTPPSASISATEQNVPDTVAELKAPLAALKRRPMRKRPRGRRGHERARK